MRIDTDIPPEVLARRRWRPTIYLIELLGFAALAAVGVYFA